MTFFIVVFCLFVSCESRTSRREPVHGGRTPSSQLSDTAQRLLTEFGLRYGIVTSSTSLSLYFIFFILGRAVSKDCVSRLFSKVSNYLLIITIAMYQFLGIDNYC